MPENPVPLKVTYLGGGSRNWACTPMRDLACCPDLFGEICEIGLPDNW
jgi:hypothetical protein